MKHLKLPALLLPALLLAACQPGDAPEAGSAAGSDEAVATVNGEPISRRVFNQYLERRSGGGAMNLDANQQRELLNQVVNVNVLASHALAQNLDEKPEWAAQLEIQRSQLLANMAIQHYLDENPITEDALRAEYQERIGDRAGTEYKARHILLETEAQAREVISELEKGADFSKLASRSIEPGAGDRGGDLGWFLPGQMVEPFADAVTAMEPGSYTTEPVKTQFGWHVIKLEDTREAPAPAFEDLRPQLETMLQQKAIESFVNGLREKAEVKIRLDAEPAPEGNATGQAGQDGGEKKGENSPEK